MALCAESAVLGERRRYLGALEQHPPDVFVCRIEELAQNLVLGRVELPQVEGPSLTREDPEEEHGLDYVDKLELLVHQLLDAGLESSQLLRIAPS